MHGETLKSIVQLRANRLLELGAL